MEIVDAAIISRKSSSMRLKLGAERPATGKVDLGRDKQKYEIEISLSGQSDIELDFKTF